MLRDSEAVISGRSFGAGTSDDQTARPPESALTPDELRARVAEIRWHHSLDLGNGIVTEGQDNSAKKLKRLKLPESFAGKSVLDIGSWDGFFAFEAERRGAGRVLATDSFVWRGGCEWADKSGFDLAKAALGSKVEELEIDVLDLSPESVGVFDVVFFLGVLYHMKHPLLSLERVASVTRDLVVIETVVDMLSYRRPAIAYYGGDELALDSTNWCAPNPAGLEAMLKTAGFRRVEIVSDVRPLWFRVAKAAYYWWKRDHQFWSAVRTDRVVVHAWK
jgi:tRNA (mo5U34)-methyltransferase